MKEPVHNSVPAITENCIKIVSERKGISVVSSGRKGISVVSSGRKGISVVS